MVLTKKNDEAVSPVIGVILMVAVTVILAAIIAAFVFGMAGNIQSSKTVGLTLTQNGSSYGILTFQGGSGLSQLTEANYTVNGGIEKQFNPKATSPVTAGNVFPTKDADATTGSRIIVIGHFNDGTNQVLIDKQF